MPFVLIVVAVISSLVLGKEVKDFVQRPSALPNSTVAPALYVAPSFTPNPTPTLEPTPTPSPYNQTQNTPQAQEPAQQTEGTNIDCVGPDGKHLQLTQKACDDFNSAWNNQRNINREFIPNPGSSGNSGNSVNSTESTVSCYTKSLGTFQTTQHICDIYQENDRQLNASEIDCQSSTGIYHTTPETCATIQANDRDWQSLRQRLYNIQNEQYVLPSPYVFQSPSPIPTLPPITPTPCSDVQKALGITNC